MVAKQPRHDSFWMVSSLGCKSKSPGSFRLLLVQILSLAFFFFSHKGESFVMKFSLMADDIYWCFASNIFLLFWPPSFGFLDGGR